MALATVELGMDWESAVMIELGELAAACRRFAESDCCDTEAFRTVVRQAEGLSRRIPAACGPVGSLVYWTLVVFKTRPADLTAHGAEAIAQALAAVDSPWMDGEAIAGLRAKLDEAGVRLKPF